METKSPRAQAKPDLAEGLNASRERSGRAASATTWSSVIDTAAPLVPENDRRNLRRRSAGDSARNHGSVRDPRRSCSSGSLRLHDRPSRSGQQARGTRRGPPSRTSDTSRSSESRAAAYTASRCGFSRWMSK